jgi:hypothetical protein
MSNGLLSALPTSRTVVCARVANVDLIGIWNEGRMVTSERWCPYEQADLTALDPGEEK